VIQSLYSIFQARFRRVFRLPSPNSRPNLEWRQNAALNALILFFSPRSLKIPLIQRAESFSYVLNVVLRLLAIGIRGTLSNHSMLISLPKDLPKDQQPPAPSPQRPLSSLLKYTPKFIQNPQYALSPHPNHAPCSFLPYPNRLNHLLNLLHPLFLYGPPDSCRPTNGS
jgi:hypothetical protein